ncbi:hypothetical protein RDWZM_002452 [Blomia tropicalis]|uniref:Uncharacterized protein n=1 Tax=Blomia tropicalis TaxID=40697 RepID=A0A9Q0MGD9_BLOTA|nr:hypothetical protein BLOT_001789 [Blomia tropicalis]KAJ6223907.1 hypothetical protein RDWZM_002452 [Blomia tropicalis]
MYKNKIILIVAVSLLPLALANGYGHAEEHGYEKEHYPPQPYKFGYDVKDGYGGTLNQKEEGDSYGNKKGTYGYTDSYGVYRQVEYVADKHGFRATVKTNEPGTANQNPADVYMHSNAGPTHYETGNTGYKAAAAAAAAYSAPSYAPVVKEAYVPLGEMSAPVYNAPMYSEQLY